MIRPVARGSKAEQLGRLFLAAVVIAFLPSLPLGNYLIYPLTILITWFHEMGHGLTALLIGQDFQRLVILPSGSGFAETTSSGTMSNVSRAVIAAGGPLGPTFVGSLLILASSRHRLWRPALYSLAGLIALSTLIWVRSTVGLLTLPLVGAVLAYIGYKGRAWLQRFALQFLGVLAALSMLRDLSYLFSYSAVIGGQPMLSDTGAMQEALLLPYWLWAIVIVALSGMMIGWSLKLALDSPDGRGGWRR
ncbi:M50 family metallopeptidase [Altererythrobacter sp.]|uniref:M50 family metallopeptidase n=1 Tax=Altererythrobacter sp. TaxID=1872480 RepID=UPI003CFE550D